MTSVTYANAPDVSSEDYLVVGLATCFTKEEGEVYELSVVEPIPSAALDAIVKGVPTSYRLAIATTLGAVLAGETPVLPTAFPPESQFCESFADRAIAAVRTYKTNPEAQSHIPPGSQYDGFNYSLERKRILNLQRSVTSADNVKQHEYTHKVL